MHRPLASQRDRFDADFSIGQASLREICAETANGAPVSLDYAKRRPFAFNGVIEEVNVKLK